MSFKYTFYALVILCFCHEGFAQVPPQQKDSTNVYDRLETYSEKRKTTKFLHRLLFKSNKKAPKSQAKKTKRQNLKPFAGKIIRHIEIVSHDPFGFSFTNPKEKANSWVEKTGNAIHIRSKLITIRNFLLIKQNMPFDALLLEESERLIRSQNFIRSVQIKVLPLKSTSDSIDISVVVLDSWSLIPDGTFSTSKTKLRIKERNFLGFGHQFNNSVTNRMSDGKYAYDLLYRVPNFKNTFIDTHVAYTFDLNNFYSKRFSSERLFYSPLIKWAGGIYLDEQFKKDSLQNLQLENGKQNFKYLTQDIWAGHSFTLFKGNSEKERTTNLISSMRLLHLDFKESPSIEYDSIRYFSNETFVMGSIGLASRQFEKDEYIFKDGIVEDVPVGTVYAITAGVQHKNQQDRLYLGAKISHGKYFKWGYLSTNFEYGTFFKNKTTQQTVYSFQANYFTNLISLGLEWKMRQFVKPQFLIGTNRVNSIGDRLTIDENNRYQGVHGNEDQRLNSAGIPGFNSGLLGTKKYVLSLQTQFYSPWEVYGFRFNPFVNFTAGMLGDEKKSISKSRFFSALGIGFIIRNDYLVFSSFQLSLSYYPTIPGQGDHIFQTNAFETDDFGFQNFQLGKPTPVWYN